MFGVSDFEAESLKRVRNIRRLGITAEEVKAEYDDWSENYNEAMINIRYHGPAVVVQEAVRRVPPSKRASTRVLDVAAGTGLVGRGLHKEGFTHIDAVEPSAGMLKKLRETRVYTNDFMEPIGAGRSTVPEDTYDLLIICGAMSEGHIPVSGLDDLVRFAKKGALVIISMRAESLETVPAYKDKLEPYMDELEEKGAWRKIERRVVPNYISGKEGVLFVCCVT